MLLTVKESAINVPMNLEARRRITFFTNSLFMIMPPAPKVRNMFSFRSVLLNISILCTLALLCLSSIISSWVVNMLLSLMNSTLKAFCVLIHRINILS